MRAEQDERVAAPGPRRRPLLFALAALAVLGLLAAALLAVLRSTGPTSQPVVLAAPEPAAETPGPATGADATAPATPPAGPDEASAAPDEPPLPALEHSDPEVRSTLADLLPPLAQPALAPDQVLRRAAVVAANFARGKLVRDKLPLPAPGGKLLVTERGDRLYLSAANHARYDALAGALAELDTDALARWFGRYEPLLDEAWRELGADGGDVRAALIAGLELVLAAPEVQGEIELVQPAVFYRYADPALESLPDTQKLLIRIGPANRQLVKERARRLRDALAAGA
jgi:hypothetical protein